MRVNIFIFFQRIRGTKSRKLEPLSTENVNRPMRGMGSPMRGMGSLLIGIQRWLGDVENHIDEWNFQTSLPLDELIFLEKRFVSKLGKTLQYFKTGGSES